MTHQPPRPDGGDASMGRIRQPAPRLVAGLLLVAVGLAGGLGVGLLMPRASAGDPSPPPGVVELPGGFEVYRQALEVVREFYVDPSAATDEALIEGSVRGLVEALGDTGHTVYLTAE